jgi:L-alanine-DL-glutamate epimerase-like enolase superfamily enzyme
VNIRQLTLLMLEDEQGVRGFGEAAPLEPYSDLGVAGVRGALERCRPLLASSRGSDHQALVRNCAATGCPAPVVAAIDLALWDLAARREGAPVWKLLGAPAVIPINVNATIATMAADEAADAAAHSLQAGFRTVKLKVGAAPGALVSAVRSAAGAEVGLRIDANGCWSVSEAIASLHQLERFDIECCEEPVHGLAAVERVSRETRIPLSLDETAAEDGALDRRACTAVCLKVSRCGGLTGLMRDASAARAAGYEIYLASTLDGPVGIAAALHAAVALAPERACGLATLGLIADRPDPFPASAGAITLDDSPGLGAALGDWYVPG